MSRPKVLIVMAAQWPRALLRAALREAGYEALGTPSLHDALAVPAGNGASVSVALIILDHTISESQDDSLLAELLARHPAALTLKLESAFHHSPPGAWSHVLRHPVTIAEIVNAIESLLPRFAHGQSAP
jgi:hypothetical protein